jgi:hypothetical protein
MRKFSLKVAARFFQRIGTRVQFPVTLIPEFDNLSFPKMRTA